MEQNFSINVNSKYFIDTIENYIVQLARTISLEQQIDIETAKIQTRQIVQRRLNQLLTDAEQKGISDTLEETKELIKKENNEYYCNIYEIFKIFEVL
jgi:3-deoxy-D-manno-octulosonate 8-phosphate phosphatase KdsC-like HAD superfamily phosphatase